MVKLEKDNSNGGSRWKGPRLGVSGFSLYVPKLRVPLEGWCQWYGSPWSKVQATVGHSFRVPGPQENVYTMAANAVLRLILKHDVNPRSIGYLALGTESSTDNAAGAIIVKGLVDLALVELGLPRLARQIEVPEIKHACLGGVYALKAALRYLACDGAGRKAIVVSSDIAEYARGSSGEPTQGAGAVAQLLEEDPALYTVDLAHCGSAAAYRGMDFRKPHLRHLDAEPVDGAIRRPDYPIFNGRYSTICYTDEALHATARMVYRLGVQPRELYNRLEGAFLHRPFARLPVNVMAALYIWGLTRNDEHLRELEAICRRAKADFAKMQEEAASSPDLFVGALGGRINEEAYPEAMKVVKWFRESPKFTEVAEHKMRLGTAKMMDIGNLYTASLPAWIAAGLEDGLEKGEELAEKTFFTLGYGSGDAAEAMLIDIVPGWQSAAGKIGFSQALAGAVDLRQNEYEALHEGLPEPSPNLVPNHELVVDRVGQCTAKGDGFQDKGIEYYRYIPAIAP
ncbi:MAG: hydroxymethylglutaryl-CoA synthase [Myxococcota bacterium]|jgi:hydroxymethylglutaryl-CoA synthase|nr:hydroxymethylglutaryl-CoA synthase [Myxococcota bacterium]